VKIPTMMVEVGAFSSIIYWLTNLNEGDNGERFGYFVYISFLFYWVRMATRHLNEVALSFLPGSHQRSVCADNACFHAHGVGVVALAALRPELRAHVCRHAPHVRRLSCPARASPPASVLMLPN
jgi:hypothetical protein